MTTSIHPLAQEQVSFPSHHSPATFAATPSSPPAMAPDTLPLAPVDDQIVPSLNPPEIRSSYHTDPTLHPHLDSPLYAPQSPDLPYPRQQQQRAYSVTAMPSELQRSVMRHQREVAEQQRRMLQDQPWWQHYYQLYHYHPPPGRKPTVLGPYLLLQTLGEGEFGKVKLAVHIETGQEVAIKLIKKDNIDSSSRMSKVEREISVLRTVRHPHIVRLYDVIETERYIGIILQCASGGELFEYILAHRYLKEKDASRLFAQLISGVHYMHQKHIVHRDLKLENLLLDKNRRVIITDFGFANQFSSAHDDLMSTSCGSPCYAAPELVVSEGMYVGSAVDIWSCGVILYAMICGYLPFDDDPANPDGDNINLLYKYILNTQLAFPSYVSYEARDLLCKMLVPDPAKRCSMETIMEHPWLTAHRPLFQKTIEELEMEAMAETPFPQVLIEPPRSPRPNMFEERRNTYAAPPRIPSVSEAQEEKQTADIDQDPKVPQNGSIDTTESAPPTRNSSAMDIDEQTLPSCPAPAASDHSKDDVVKEEKDDNADTQEDNTQVKMSSPEPSQVSTVEPGARNVSSFELPASAHVDSSSSTTERDAKTDQKPYPGNPLKENGQPQPSPSVSTKKQGRERILSFLSGSTSLPTGTSKKSARPFSMTVDNRTAPGNSILHAKFLSSMNRSTRDVSETGKPEHLGVSLSTPQGVREPALSLTAAATHLSQNTSRSPRPTVGLSQPVRSRRPKALSLLVADKDAIKVQIRRPQTASNKPSVVVTESNMSVTMLPTHPEQHTSTGLPSSPTSPDVRQSKQRSAGKKLMDWFKTKPLSTKERVDLTNYQVSSMLAVPSGKPLGSYALDFNDAKLRTHHGAVDQNALTSRPPQEAFAEIRQTLVSMGIDVKGDGEYKLKCVRRKRPAVLHGATKTSPSSKTSTTETNHTAQPNTADHKKRKTTTGAPKFRMLLRRTSHTATTADDVGNAPNVILYGDPAMDPGEEVRFSVELCKIKNLPGLYIVDVRRMRGNVRSYKHLYHAVLEALDLSGKGGYMSTRVPNQDNTHLSPQKKQDRLSTASSQDSSVLEEHKDES